MTSEVSREDTTHRKVAYLAQLQFGAQPGSRALAMVAMTLFAIGYGGVAPAACAACDGSGVLPARGR